MNGKSGERMQEASLTIRRLEQRDIAQIAEAFKQLGWHKPVLLYERYLMEQHRQVREVYVAFVEGKFAGYLTVCWSSSYEPFQSEGIPEIVDFNVLPEYRRQGIGTQLMERAEHEIARMSVVAGIGVGMTPDYGVAQRLYILRGYIPDGRGLHYRGRPVRYGDQIIVDDDLAFYFTKKLS
jgi:GNAT superfamily N-acetyltransferase